jgi:hypothetical protein
VKAPQEYEFIKKSPTVIEKIANIVFIFLFLFPLIVVVLGDSLYDGTTLTQHPLIGIYISFCMFWCGTVLLAWQFLFFPKRQKITENYREKPFHGFFTVVLYFIFIIPYFCRRVIEILAFTNVNATTVEAHLLIAYGGGRYSWDYSLHGSVIESKGREVSIKVNYELKARYYHTSTHDKDCFLVPLQTGRWGVQRIVGPNVFEEGIASDRIIKDCLKSISH